MLETYDNYIQAASATYNVPVVWIKSVIMQESSGNPNAFRAEPQINDASYGLMQLLYSTAQGLGYTGTPEGLYDPATNIDLGTKLLGQWHDKLGDDFERVYSAYNSGSPDRYLTSSQVASNVQKAVAWLQKVVTDEPVIASSGVLGAVLIVLLIWYYTKRKGH